MRNTRVWICWILGCVLSLDAAIIHVSPTATDNGADGSGTRPFRSLNAASAAASPGDTILLAAGVYTGRSETITCNGTALLPITIRPSMDTAAFDGTGVALSSSQSLVTISSSRYVLLHGITVRNSQGRGLSTFESTNVTVRGCRVQNIRYRGLGGSGDDIVFENNEVYRACLVNENEGWGTGGGWPGALQTTLWWNSGKRSARVVIRGNRVHECWGEGIIANFLDSSEITGNRVENCYSIGIYLDNANVIRVDGNVVFADNNAFARSDISRRMNGVTLAMEAYSGQIDLMPRDIVITNNLIVGTGRGITYWHDETNTLASNSYADVRIVHNVVVGQQLHAVHFAAVGSGHPTPQNCIIKNNIFYRGGDGSTLTFAEPAAWTFGNNCYPDGVPVADNSPASFSASPGFTGTPTGASAENFRIASGSPCRDAGDDVRAYAPVDMWGTTRDIRPDVGLHEYAATTISFRSARLPLPQSVAGRTATPTLANALGRIIVPNSARSSGAAQTSRLAAGFYFFDDARRAGLGLRDGVNVSK